MSDLKGFSLRTKKNRRGPKDSAKGAPSVQDAPEERSRHALRDTAESTGNSTDPRAGKSQERLKPGGATSDIVKKRYSIRYAHAPDFGQGEVPSMPGVPKIPQAYAQQGGRDDSPAPATKGDIRVLKDKHMQPEEGALLRASPKCRLMLINWIVVSNFLATASETDIAEYEKSLKKVKNRASTDLQHNVYQNRTQFIKISKEAEKLRTEMQTLRGLMSELTMNLNEADASSKRNEYLEVDDGSSSARKRANRSSVANLEAMWNTQLQALWKNIEGSQKWLPIIPGRHIVQESGNWVELDAATWKPRRPVHIVLLNDHLLVATRKRKRVDPNTPASKAPTKLVAERCWPLQDIDMIDLSSGAKEIKGPFQEMNDIANSITVRHGQQSFTYRSDRQDAKDKTNLLLAFKRTLDELRRAERAEADEMGNKSQETLNYLVARDPAISRSPDLLNTLSNSKNRPEILIDVDGKQRNLRWVEGQIDELDIDIALQRFDAAVDRVEQLRKLAKGLKSNTVAQDLINVKVDERAAKLAGRPLALPKRKTSTDLSLRTTNASTSTTCCPAHRNPKAYVPPLSPPLRPARPINLPNCPQHNPRPPYPCHNLRRRSSSIYNSTILHILHPHPQHSIYLSSLFPPKGHVRGRGLGKRLDG
jgi:hypothetical protein